jgi:hypothetical protein
MQEFDNFVGRWNTRYDAYRWALEHVFPHCSQNLLGAVCVDLPHWPSDSNFHYDYHAKRVRSIGRARAQRWLSPPIAGFTTILLLPASLPGG